jgi:hypothetical protein
MVNTRKNQYNSQASNNQVNNANSNPQLEQLSHTESTYARCAPNNQSSTVEPAGSPATATATTTILVQT